MTFTPNGCGPKTWRYTIPTWHATELCKQHDWAYYLGGTEEDRQKADYALYDGMRRQAAKENIFRRLWMLYEAWVFYRWLREYGDAHWHHGAPRAALS